MTKKQISVVDHHGNKKTEEKQKEETIEDGFGNFWSKKCAMCGKMTMEVVRPGKVQCIVCG